MPEEPKAKLLGIAASLRNARWGHGNRKLIESLRSIPDEAALNAFLKQESELHLENFVQAGRKDGKPFLEIYKNLRSSRGERGLSNSEVALAAALWAALQKGVDIDHLSLSEHFTAWGERRDIPALKRALLEADGLLISGPVYFGDRGSLAHSLIELIRKDEELARGLAGKLYGGIAVGAKRNGGQETTLIYQMLDMVGLGMLAVGNDSETTSQYGGTGHAGDVGTMHKDKYGIDTSMGAGRRMASVMRKLRRGLRVSDRVRVLFILLQDSGGFARRGIEELAGEFRDTIDASVLDVANGTIHRCLACDICPTHIDLDEVYRCIIKAERDDLEKMHPELLNHDVLIPVTASFRDARDSVSNYQTFVERTRYLRRGDYVFSDLLTAPLVFEELGVHEYYSVRMLTSMIRHHTVMSKPLIAHVQAGKVLNRSQLSEDFGTLVASGSRLAAARLSEIDGQDALKYRPVGYVLSAHKDQEDEKLKKREAMVQNRRDSAAKMARERLKPTNGSSAERPRKTRPAPAKK